MFRSTTFILLAAFAVGACSDLATVPDRRPAEVRLSHDLLTATEQDKVNLGVTVVDNRGNPITDVPQWSTLEWITSDPQVVALSGPDLTAVAPGEATVTASLAGLEGTAIVRVNPKSIQLDIAAVMLFQEGSPTGFLAPGVATTLQVFLTADKLNFFQPTVRATLLANGQEVASLFLEREGISIPTQLDANDPTRAWVTTIPAALVQPGLQLVVEADPERAFSHSGGSADRYPAGGAFALAIGEASLLLRAEGAYLTQSIQRFDGSVPLVQGRDALLRVFLTADEENDLRPAVRATFYGAGEVIHQVEMTAATPSIPLLIQEGLLSRSWNVMIPGSVLQPGVSMVIEADPHHTIAIKPGSINRIPATGSLPLDVRVVPPLWLRMVPILQAETGTTGNITEANLAQYVGAAQAKFPLAQVNVDIRSPYLTYATASSFDGWRDILFELRALRIAESSGRYHYGVLRHPGSNNIGGLGFIGYPAAIGYDHAVRGPETFAHELGHNFNLLHAPCGGPSDADPQFPYSAGGIGQFGFNLFTGEIKLPNVEKDLMSYCGPEWISDYSYIKALNHRQTYDWSFTGPRAIQDAILVWGGVANGALVLEPTFRLDMIPHLPSGTGRYQIRGLDAAGSEIFSYRFDADDVDHIGARSFAFAIPNSVAQADRLAEIVLSGPEGQLSRGRSAQPPSPAVRSIRPDSFRGEVAWDAADSPMALIRDSQTGEVLSFARGGSFSLPGRIVEVTTSDGVRSTTRTIDLR